MYHIRSNAEQSVRSLLKDVAKRAGTNILSAIDYLDDGSPVSTIFLRRLLFFDLFCLSDPITSWNWRNYWFCCSWFPRNRKWSQRESQLTDLSRSFCSHLLYACDAWSGHTTERRLSCSTRKWVTTFKFHVWNPIEGNASLTVKIPPKSLLSPSRTAAVCGGNVLTSQRIVDVVLKAFHAAAASQGCTKQVFL